MTRPPPPKPYETWLDCLLRDAEVSVPPYPWAAAELAELREDRDHWRTAQKTTQAKGELMLAELAELRAELATLKAERHAAFGRHLEHASDTVRTWPGWKRTLLGGPSAVYPNRADTTPPDPADAYLERAKERG